MNQKFQFIGQPSAQLPIQAILATSQKGPRLIKIPAEHPLFSVILSMRNSFDFSNMTPHEINRVIESSLSELDRLLNDAFSHFKTNDKIVLKGHQETQTFIDAMELIHELINAKILELLSTQRQFVVDSIHLFLNFFSQIQKKIVLKNKKSKVAEIISDLILNLSACLNILYFQNASYHQAELNCEKTMALLRENKDPNQITFSTQIIIAKLYFKFGHFDAALRLVKEMIPKLNNNKPFLEIDGGLLDLIVFLKNEVLSVVHDKKSLVGLELSQITLSLIHIALNKCSLLKNSKILSTEESTIFIRKSEFLKSKFNELKKEAEADFISFQKKYLSELSLTMKNSNAIRKMIAKVKHNFAEHWLSLEVKSTEYGKVLTRVLSALGISVEIHDSVIKVNLYHCSPERLAKACEKSLVILEKEAQAAKMLTDANQRLAQAKVMTPEKSPSDLRAALQPVSSEMIEKPSSSKNKKRSTLSTQAQINSSNSSNTSVFTEEPIENSSFTYHWPNAGLMYQSNEGNTGKVKMLTHEEEGLTPNGLYFGYMPDYILNDEHYDPGFAEKLNTGKIRKDAIRRITQEMQTIGASDCFIFKIVIRSKNARIYGWVEDVCVDSEGKQHFLICFGLMSDHKQKNLLKNPQKFKEKMMQNSQTIEPMTQTLPAEDSAENFFAEFTNILYGESSGIPNNIKLPLKEFFEKDFTHFYYSLQSDLNEPQKKLLLSQLLKMNTLLRKLESEVNVEAQLSLVEAILNALSELHAKNYSSIVAPLTFILQEAAKDYHNITAKTIAFSDQLVAEPAQISQSAHSDDQKAEQLLMQLTQIGDQTETNLKQFEQVASTQNIVETQQIEVKDLLPHVTATRSIMN